MTSCFWLWLCNVFDMDRYGFHWVLIVASKWRVKGIEKGECVIKSVT